MPVASRALVKPVGREVTRCNPLFTLILSQFKNVTRRFDVSNIFLKVEKCLIYKVISEQNMFYARVSLLGPVYMELGDPR